MLIVIAGTLNRIYLHVLKSDDCKGYLRIFGIEMKQFIMNGGLPVGILTGLIQLLYTNFLNAAVNCFEYLNEPEQWC